MLLTLAFRFRCLNAKNITIPTRISPPTPPPTPIATIFRMSLEGGEFCKAIPGSVLEREVETWVLLPDMPVMMGELTLALVGELAAEVNGVVEVGVENRSIGMLGSIVVPRAVPVLVGGSKFYRE